MSSKFGLAEGLLVLISGILMYSFAPGQPLFVPPPGHVMTHFIGGGLAILFGIIGLALYSRIGKGGLGVAILSVVLGIVFILDAPAYLIYPLLQPHGLAMESIGAVTMLVGIIGIIAAAVTRQVRPAITAKP
jgi:hypothetical protein